MSATGGPEVLVPDEVADPHAGPGEVVVAVAAAGVNFIDTYQRDGTYTVPLPYTPGLEGAGVVVEVGEGAGLTVGDRVAWADAPGSYAERVVVRAERAVPVPDALPDDEAASALLQGMTAHYLIASVGGVRSGDTVLVHAGAGGTGLVLTQLARRPLFPPRAKDPIDAIRPPSCDEAAGRFLGLSFAGWNAVASALFAAVALRSAVAKADRFA